MMIFPGRFVFFFFQFGMDFFVDTSSSFSFKGNWSSFYLFILYFILKRQKLEPSPRDIDIYSTFDFVFLVSFLLCTISYLCLRCTCFPPPSPLFLVGLVLCCLYLHLFFFRSSCFLFDLDLFFFALCHFTEGLILSSIARKLVSFAA